MTGSLHSRQVLFLQLFLYTSIRGIFHDRRIPNFSRPSIRGLFQLSEIQRLQSWPWIQCQCRNSDFNGHFSRWTGISQFYWS